MLFVDSGNFPLWLCVCAGLSPIKINMSSEKFSDINLKTWTQQYFHAIWEISRHKVLLQLAWQIYETFRHNILIGTQFENLWKFSLIWELSQNSENFLLIELITGFLFYHRKSLSSCWTLGSAAAFQVSIIWLIRKFLFHLKNCKYDFMIKEYLKQAMISLQGMAETVLWLISKWYVHFGR